MPQNPIRWNRGIGSGGSGYSIYPHDNSGYDAIGQMKPVQNPIPGLTTFSGQAGAMTQPIQGGIGVTDNLSYRKSLEDLLKQFQDPNSEYFKKFSSYLQKTIPRIGTDSLLALSMAQGGSYGGSQFFAGEQAKQFEANRNDQIGSQIEKFALESQKNSLEGYGILLGDEQSRRNLAQQQSQYDDSQEPSLIDYAMLLAPLFI